LRSSGFTHLRVRKFIVGWLMAGPPWLTIPTTAYPFGHKFAAKQHETFRFRCSDDGGTARQAFAMAILRAK
jgi:hypothetical protein